MRHRSSIFSTFFLVLLAGCQVTNPVRNETVFPSLSEPVVPDSIFIGSQPGMPVSVRASDPQGLGDIETVQCFVFPSDGRTLVFQDTLKDDGLDGDILLNDGVYVGRIAGGDVEDRAGTYRIGFLAIDRNRNASDTLFVPFKAVTGKQNSPPRLERPAVPDTLLDENLGSVFMHVQVQDPEGYSDIDSVYYDVYPPFSPKSSVRLSLRDDGAEGDAVGQDGIYSFSGDMTAVLTIPGMYAFRFQAKDKGGMLSLPQVAKVVAVIPNQPPVLSHLSAPDVVSRNDTAKTLITLQVYDRQGLGDIKRVYFLSTKPDGTPGNNGNPIVMYDDGMTLGDVKAGDGVYSVKIEITPQAMLGKYRFDFYAEDLSGAVSESLSHFITVKNEIPE